MEESVDKREREEAEAGIMHASPGILALSEKPWELQKDFKQSDTELNPVWQRWAWLSGDTGTSSKWWWVPRDE